MVQTISSLMCEPLPPQNPKMKILLNVTISRDGNYAFNKYSNERGDYFSVNPKVHATIRYITEEPWRKDHQILITQRNIFQLRIGFKRFYRNFQNSDIYTYDDKGKITELLSDDGDIVIIPLTMGQLLRLKPTVVSDKSGKIYPGINLTINRESNQVDLSIDEFEEVYDLFTTINLYQSGLTLLQTYIGMRKTSVEETIDNINKQQNTNNPDKEQKPRFRGSMFENVYNKEMVKSPPPKAELPKTLDDLY